MLNLFKNRHSSSQAVTKSRRPRNTTFRQQRLKAWQPILSPQHILPLLLVLACVFAPIGIGLLVSAISVQDLVIRYDECEILASEEEFTLIPDELVSYHFNKPVEVKPAWKLLHDDDTDNTPVCRLQFEIPDTLKSSIYVYYKLTNYYQNHREYVRSFDENQLNGDAIPAGSLNTDCNPLRKDPATGKAIYPCGLIANSLFNDTFGRQFTGERGSEDYVLTNKGIARSVDKDRYKRTSYLPSNIVPPPNWHHMFPNGYNSTNIPNLETWEEFQIWMRTAALPEFYKLALKNTTHELPRGHYTYDIKMHYPVASFNGTKSFVLTTNDIIGAKNISLGILYLIVAIASAFFAIIFLAKIVIRPKKVENHTYLEYDPDNSNRNDALGAGEFIFSGTGQGSRPVSFQSTHSIQIAPGGGNVSRTDAGNTKLREIL